MCLARRILGKRKYPSSYNNYADLVEKLSRPITFAMKIGELTKVVHNLITRIVKPKLCHTMFGSYKWVYAFRTILNISSLKAYR